VGLGLEPLLRFAKNLWSLDSFGTSTLTFARSEGVIPNRPYRAVSCASSLPLIVPARSFALNRTMLSAAQRSDDLPTPAASPRTNSRQIFFSSSLKCFGTLPIEPVAEVHFRASVPVVPAPLVSRIAVGVLGRDISTRELGILSDIAKRDASALCGCSS